MTTNTEDTADMVSKALRRAWQLGQTYWQQADSESYSANKRAEATAVMFAELVNNTIAALAQQPQPSAQPFTPAELVLMNESKRGASFGQITTQACACFPGTCRGGEVINGRLANGQVCAAAAADGA